MASIGDAFTFLLLVCSLLLGTAIMCVDAFEYLYYQWHHPARTPVAPPAAAAAPDFHDGVCCICLDADDARLSWVRFPCGHTFHRACAVQLRPPVACPLCGGRAL